MPTGSSPPSFLLGLASEGSKDQSRERKSLGSHSPPPSLPQVPVCGDCPSHKGQGSFRCPCAFGHISGFQWHLVFLSPGLLMVRTVTLQVHGSVPRHPPPPGRAVPVLTALSGRVRPSFLPRRWLIQTITSDPSPCPLP